ncbi:hypothetical protein BT93_J1716 [Corymbia citriodora subsp. variegata]|nr:hypothetical protein BT93_J1716 [Corymbia citriodora subsp. variegata]
MRNCSKYGKFFNLTRCQLIQNFPPNFAPTKKMGWLRWTQCYERCRQVQVQKYLFGHANLIIGQLIS